MDREKTRVVAEQIFRDMAGAMTAGMVYVGTRTGLFRAMQGAGPMNLEDVVRASRMQPRYVEEWLKGMAAAGYLAYDPKAATYALSDEHAYFLASDGTDHFAGGMFEMVPPLLRRRARPHQPRPVREPLHRPVAQAAAGSTRQAARRRAHARRRLRQRSRLRRVRARVSESGDRRHRPRRALDRAGEEGGDRPSGAL
jgi:hypothetical protein